MPQGLWSIIMPVHNYSWEVSRSTLASVLSWPTLEQRRAEARLSTMYKITNNLLDINPNQYLKPGHSQKRSNHPHKHRQISTSHNYKNSFFPQTIAQRNRLSSNVHIYPQQPGRPQGCIAGYWPDNCTLQAPPIDNTHHHHHHSIPHPCPQHWPILFQIHPTLIPYSQAQTLLFHFQITRSLPSWRNYASISLVIICLI